MTKIFTFEKVDLVDAMWISSSRLCSFDDFLNLCILKFFLCPYLPILIHFHFSQSPRQNILSQVLYQLNL